MERQVDLCICMAMAFAMMLLISGNCCLSVSLAFVHHYIDKYTGAQWLSGRVLDSRQRGCGFEPHRCHCVVSLSKNINPSLVLVQPRKACPFITERLLMGRKE